jgi:two-component system, OmpR family, phosphate regulon sensor histidine kinase PhoR
MAKSPGTATPPPTERHARLPAAYEAALELASELDPDQVLQRIPDLARKVVPAKYAALGVTDEHGVVHTFITSGITARERRLLGDIPQGHGLIGELIRNRQPLLVADIAADPRSVGYPANHPPMNALLGVPILLGERALGNLYLTEPLESDTFTEDDLAALNVLAIHTAQAIDRASLFAEARASQRRAEEQRDHLDVILNSMAAAVLIQNAPDGRVEVVNNAARSMLLDAATFGSRLPQAGRDYAIRHANGSELPMEQWPAFRAWRGEMVRNTPYTFTTPRGRHIPVLAQAAPLRDSEGQVSRVVIVFQDITRIREAEQLKDDFLSLVSHELRTPLTAIHGGAYLLATQHDGVDSETRKEILDDLVQESERLDRTLGNILTLTAIEAGQVDPELEPLLVGALIRQRVAGMSKRHPDRDFTVDVSPGVPPAEGSAEALSHVLDNLYENAVKYSPPGTPIDTRAVADRATIRISITDEGYGIAPENVSGVFERFRRPGADPSVRGMGLGLYLSRHLMRSMRGSISVSSPGVGKGATFTIVLPIAAD